MKQLCYTGILKEGFSASSSPVMLISRKLTKDKRVVTDFRYLNVRIAKPNLAYPLIKDTFSVLGSSRCEVLSVLDLKDAFHSLRKILWNTSIFWKCILFISENAYGVKHLPFDMAIIYNVILDCLQSQKYCEAIMDDLLLFTPSIRSHIDTLEYLLQALLKNGLKISPKKCQLSITELQYMGNEIFIQNKRVCMQPLRNRLEAIKKLQPPLQWKDAEALWGWSTF